MTSPYGTGTVSTFPVNTGDPNVDPLLVWGYRWGNGPVGTPATVTYSFPAADAAWIGDYWDNEPFDGFTPFSAAQQNAARQALAAWSDVANITFQEVPDKASDVGDIRFGNSNVVTNSTAAAWGYFPYATPSFEYPEAGDVWFDAKYPPNLQLQPGQFGYSTMVHEIGHAIGLDHPFADEPGEIALPPSLDNESYTIMSYTANLATLAYASTPMLLDILAIQYIYGANMATRTGNDVYNFSASVEVQKAIWDAGGVDTLDFSNQTRGSKVDLSEGTFSYFGGTTAATSSILAIAYGVTIEHATGGSGADRIEGNAVANNLLGGSGNDVLIGEIGNDYLNGGAGLDQLFGGAGNDTYVIDNVGDVLNEQGNSDTDDKVLSVFTVDLRIVGGGAIEHATLLGTAALNAVGTAGSNTLTGNDGANILNGIGGADVMIGGKGNDTYVVDNVGDQVVDSLAGASGGIDLVKSSVSFSLFGGNVENLTLLGASAIDARGNGLANVLTGNDGANRLTGGAGGDTMIGGKGDDTYSVDSASDIVSETVANNVGGGIDTVESAITFTLATRANIENLTLLSNLAINGTGNALSNIIRGNAAANILDGLAGADQLFGGAGNDIYIIDNAGDVVNDEGSADLNDTVKASVSIAAGFAGIENYVNTGAAAWNFTAAMGLNNQITGGNGSDTLNGWDGDDAILGNGGTDYLIGSSGDDYLDGGIGADKLRGAAGNDIYVIDNAGDTVDEAGTTDGIEEIRTTISVNLAMLGGALEHVTLLGTGAINATGNSLNNNLTGNDGANILSGDAGADVMTGGKGNDTYVIDSLSDQVIENADGGVDTVQVAFSSAVSSFSNIENLTLTGSGNIDATGDSGANVLTGNSGKNVLDGGGDNDTLIGGAGDDTYVIDSLDDVISEVSGGGTDTIVTVGKMTNLFFYLDDFANVENVTLADDSEIIQVAGNSGANTLTSGDAEDDLLGNDGNDRLIGNDGGDDLTGGAGNDYLLGGDGQDRIWGGAGRDTIDYDHLSEAGDSIFDFAVGASGDVLDLHDLLVDIGYGGADAFADGYITFEYIGSTTRVNIDTDGQGAGMAITLVTLAFTTFTQADTDNYIV